MNLYKLWVFAPSGPQSSCPMENLQNLNISDRHFRKERKDILVVMELAWHLGDLNLISLSARLPFVIPDTANHFPYPTFSSLEWRRPFKYLNQASFKNILFFYFFFFPQIESHLKAQSSKGLDSMLLHVLKSRKLFISNTPYKLQVLKPLESLPFQNYCSVIRKDTEEWALGKLINKMHSWPITSNNFTI